MPTLQGAASGRRIGIVGAGGIAHPHAAAWLGLDAHVAVFSLAGAQTLAAEFSDIRVVDSLDELLRWCDVADICTPTPTHSGLVVTAAAAGVDIVCEKPLSRDHASAVTALRACEQAGVRLYPGHVVRFFPEYAAAKKAVDDGAVGIPAVLRFSRRGAAPVSPWFADADASGGILLDQMIHDFDFARWVAGEVVRVFATVTSGGQSTLGYAILTHAGGALSHCHGGWLHPRTRFRTSFSISGSSGLLTHDSTMGAALTLDVPTEVPTGGGLLPDTTGTEPPFRTELREYAVAFAGGAEPRVSATDALAAVDIGLAAVESARTGHAIEVTG